MIKKLSRLTGLPYLPRQDNSPTRVVSPPSPSPSPLPPPLHPPPSPPPSPLPLPRPPRRVRVLMKTVGNLSTDVFEPRTSTGSRMFSLLAWFCFLPWTLLFLCLRFDVTNATASKRSKEGKIQLPVDVRGSKTSLLIKVPYLVSSTWDVHGMHPGQQLIYYS